MDLNGNTNKMEKIKNYLIIGLSLIVMILLLLKGCSEEKVIIKEVIKVEKQSDTVFTKEVLVKFKTIKYPEYKYIYKLDTMVDNISVDSLAYNRIYNDSLKDSNLTIFSDIKVLGILSQLDLSYKLKPKPSLITNNITTTITNTEFRPNKVQIYTGLQLGGNKTSFNISPFININVKKVTIQYNYGVLNKTHSIGVGYKIFNSKK